MKFNHIWLVKLKTEPRIKVQQALLDKGKRDEGII